MTISRKAVVMALLLSAVLPLISHTSWAQGKQWTDKQCRNRMVQLFKDAYDPTVNPKEVYPHLGIESRTEFATQCRSREMLSFEIMERHFLTILAEREETAGAEWRFDLFGEKVEKNKKNFESQSSFYDPGGR